jgi:hypothetical protein
MANWEAFIPAVILLTVIFFIPLIAAYFALKSWLFSRRMRRLAFELSLHYTQPIPFRAPSINGFYKGRDVVVDYFNDNTRIRVFHTGEVKDEFTIGTLDHFRLSDLKGAMRPDSTNREFDDHYRICGGDTLKIRKYLDLELQSKAMASKLSFTVGPFDVSSSLDGRVWDKERILGVLDVLMVAAGRADHF